MRRQERKRHTLRTEFNLLRLRNDRVVERALRFADFHEERIPSAFARPARSRASARQVRLRPPGCSDGASPAMQARQARRRRSPLDRRNDRCCLPSECGRRCGYVRRVLLARRLVRRSAQRGGGSALRSAQQLRQRHELAHVNPAQQRHLEVIPGLRRSADVELGFRQHIERAQQIFAREARHEPLQPISLALRRNFRIVDARGIDRQAPADRARRATAREQPIAGRNRARPRGQTARTRRPASRQRRP